jgi:cystinosin
LGYVKLICTVVKYMPQVWLNYQRQSTVGWSILQIMFDITGGVLSLAQLILDASFQGDWSGITGNPLKLGLGNISIAFDVVFIVQHFLLYPGRDDPSAETEGYSDTEQPLLD